MFFRGVKGKGRPLRKKNSIGHNISMGGGAGEKGTGQVLSTSNTFFCAAFTELGVILKFEISLSLITVFNRLHNCI